MKNVLCIFISAILTLVLFACGSSPAPVTSDAETVTSDTFPETVPETAEPDEERKAVRELNCVKGEIKSGVCEVRCAPSGVIALQDDWTDCRFLVVDGERDAILARYEHKETDDSLVGVSNGGEVISVNYVDGMIRIFSEDGVKEITPDVDIGEYRPQFDPETERLYGFKGGELISIGLDGRVRTELVFARDVTVLCVETVKRLALTVSGSDNDVLQSKIGFADYSGNEICSFDADCAYATFDDGCIAVTKTYYDDEGGSETHVRLFSVDSGEAISGFSFPGDCGFRFGSDTRYAYSISFEGFERSYLRFADVRSGKEADLSGLPGLGGYYLSITGEYAYPGDRAVFGMTDVNGSVSVLIVDPSVLTYSSSVSALEPYETPDSPAIASHLSSVRSFADSIEERYGVRILIGDEVYSAAEQGEYKVTSTTSDEDFYSDEEETADVVNMLNIIDTSLSRYPEGFTRSFINSRGKGGLRFLLVRDLASDQNEKFSAAGLQYTTGAWYNIALDVDSIDENSVHHEIWHASEILIDLLTDGIDENEWSKLNPEGFTYHYDFDTYTDNEEIMDYVLYSSDDPYFTRIYSTVTPQEDRATLIEETLSMIGDSRKRNSFIYSYPHLAAKLDHLARLSEECFGYVYWDKMTEE